MSNNKGLYQESKMKLVERVEYMSVMYMLILELMFIIGYAAVAVIMYYLE